MEKQLINKKCKICNCKLFNFKIFENKNFTGRNYIYDMVRNNHYCKSCYMSINQSLSCPFCESFNIFVGIDQLSGTDIFICSDCKNIIKECEE